MVIAWSMMAMAPTLVMETVVIKVRVEPRLE